MPDDTPLPLLNADLSWLAYNDRILDKARDASVPLLERLRFLTYCSQNLDEFFMSRVGFLRDQLDAEVSARSPDGLTPGERLSAIRARVREHIGRMYDCLGNELFPALRAHGIVVESFRNLGEGEQARLRDYFKRHIAPLLTPLAIDPGHPFPFVTNRALNIAAVVESSGGEHVVLMKVPQTLPRFIQLDDGRTFVPIGSLISAHLQSFFPSMSLLRTTIFRFIRNSEIAVDDDTRDLRESMEAELRRRERKQVVFLEIDRRADDVVTDVLLRGGGVSPADLYRVDGFLKISDLAEICDRIHDAALHYEPFNPRIPPRLASTDDIFSIIASGDVLLHRPYDSFAPVIELLHAAATDPAVVAITQTLYQTDEQSAVAEKLMLAALSGKQVIALVELQARFEERRNIGIARRLQDAGVQVVYGIVGMKTHCKLTLVVRREAAQLRRYLHTSTGNYSVVSSRGYTDLDLMTASDELGADASLLFNFLAGYSAATMNDVFEGAERPRWERFIVGPVDYLPWLLRAIAREAEHARAGRPARIVAKLNALSEPSVIAALYDASGAGVPIELIVRGICCLVPGVPGRSENIRVVSIVDRFLEHSRIMFFENGGARDVYLLSGDWMPRNFESRIEVAVPLLDERTRRLVTRQILPLMLADNTSSWDLLPDGTWKRRGRGERAAVAAQESFIQLARTESVRLGDFEEAIEEGTRARKRAGRQRR